MLGAWREGGESTGGSKRSQGKFKITDGLSLEDLSKWSKNVNNFKAKFCLASLLRENTETSAWGKPGQN